MPDFLKRNHDLDLKTVGLPLVVIYLVADVGSIGGGWLSSHLIKRGWATNAARKTAMLVSARAGRPTCSRSSPTCSPSGRAARSWALAAWQARTPAEVQKPNKQKISAEVSVATNIVAT